MGIYVHPLTKDTAVLEQLAGVPQSTAARLRTIESQHPYHLTDDGEGQAMFDTIIADEDLETFRSFEMSGWGRVSAEFYHAVGQDSEYCYGSVHTPAVIAHLLRLQGVALGGVPIEKLGGIGWG